MNGNAWWLFVRFAEREVSNRFAGSMLGGLWAFVHPLALLLIYSFVFTTVLRVRLPAQAAVPYLVYMAVALWPWLAFQEAVSRGAMAVVGNASLVKKVRFDHALVVHAAVASSFAIQLLGFVLVLAYLMLSGQPLSLAGMPLLLFCLCGLFALATGLGMLLGALQVFVRDIEQGLGHALGILFYLSPILYTADMVPAWLRGYMLLNPIAILIEGIRDALLHGRAWPGMPEIASLLACLALAGAGVLVFRRLSPHFEESL